MNFFLFSDREFYTDQKCSGCLFSILIIFWNYEYQCNGDEEFLLKLKLKKNIYSNLKFGLLVYKNFFDKILCLSVLFFNVSIQ